MSRLFLALKFRGHSSKTSHEDEGAYILSEARRDDSFRNSLDEFRQLFAEEEKAQAEGAKAREEEFDRMMANFSQLFDVDYGRWEQMFFEADARQEETFEKNEAGRQTVFLEGQVSRAATFEKEQVARHKRSEWHDAARAILFEQGRQARKDVCAAIDTALGDQFKKLLETQETSFIFHEDRRDDIVRKLINDKNNGGINSSTAVESINDDSAFPRVRRPRTRSASPVTPSMVRRPRTISPHAPRVYYPSRSRSRSRSPVRIVIPPSVYSPVPSPLPLRRASISNHSSSNNSKYKEDDFVQTSQRSKGSFQNRFIKAQKVRTQTFLEEERDRQRRFRGAEEQREASEDQRSGFLAKKEQAYADKARDLFQFQANYSDGRERARAGKDTQRDKIFKAAQDRCLHAFDLLLLQIERQIETEKDHENSLVAQLKHTTELLNRRQITQLKRARAERAARFVETQKRRETNLAVTTSMPPGTTAASESWDSVRPVEEHVVYHAPTVIVGDRASRSRSRSSIRSRRYHRHSYSPPRIPSPVTGFAGPALFRGANIQDPLPVPEVDNSAESERRQETGFLDLQRKHQLAFSRSQNRRQETFERNTQIRDRTFSANETRRENVFRKEQRDRKASFEQKQDERNANFRQTQQLRETRFQEAEDKRARDFQRSESDRDRQFKESEKSRDARFHEKMRELQNECFEDERRRNLELEAWGAELLREREETQSKAYNKDEAERAAIFERSLGAFVLKNTG